jgi:hypothetical protein
VESQEGMDALTVLGKSTFHDRVTVAGGGVDVTGPSVIDGVLWIAGESFTPFDCRGWAHFGDSVAIDGGVSAMTGAWFGGLLNANGGAAVTGTLGVDGPCFFDGIVEIDSDCRTEFLCRGWSHFESDIVVDGALHVGGGILDMADLEVDGRCEIMNGLAVNNGSTLMGPTIIDDIVRIDRNCWTQFDCLGWAHFADGMAIDGTLGVAQFLWVGQGLTVEGDATVRQDLLVEGDLEVLGNKNAVVDTSVGMRKVYAQESPECWFEDFGQGRLDGGRATVEFDSLFLDTVTIDSDHPFMVFITPTGPMGDYYIEKSGASFIVVAENASAGATFDWRVVAKRRGYENDRLEPAKGVRAK